MKSKRYTPWMFISLAILVFLMVMLLSAKITMSLTPLPEKLSLDRLFNFQDNHSIFMPILSQSSSPEGIVTEKSPADKGLGVQDLGEDANP